MRDNSPDIPLVQGSRGHDHFLTMTMGENERLATKKAKETCKMRCTHETSLETTAGVADDPARVLGRVEEVDNAKRLHSGFK